MQSLHAMRNSRLLAAFSPLSRIAPGNTLLSRRFVLNADSPLASLNRGFSGKRFGTAIAPNYRNHDVFSRLASTRNAFIASNSRLVCQQYRFSSNKTPSTDTNSTVPEIDNGDAEPLKLREPGREDIHRGFERSEKASQAAQINLSAKLSKDGASHGKQSGFGEIWRLIKIARPEAKVLSLAFVLLLISSTVTMSIPFSIGKILDIATSSNPDAVQELLGLSLPWFYVALASVLTVGAAANYGRIIILRIVGERIVSRLRSTLFRRTYIQDAEFFDANRVGDLISRLSSDTIIVGKSITQNLSDGLRSGVSGIAGFGMMAYVSLKLSSILALLFPPIALGAFFYGRSIRTLSRKIQKNLGTLTKIAEERLGNVKTSQSFAGEVLEVNRYNKQVRKIFELGKKESFVSATFFSAVSNPVALCMYMPYFARN